MSSEKESIVESYTRTLETLIKKESLYINDLLYQTSIFLIFINKGFNDLSDLKQRRVYARNFLELYYRNLPRFDAVAKTFDERSRQKSIKMVNPNALNELKVVLDQHFEILQDNLRLYASEEDKKAKSFSRAIKKFC